MANEIRLRSNNQQGTITDNPLTNVATTINSAGFVDLPVVDATSHLMLILDPLETAGPAEIVQVTAHTAAATSVTVVRAQESSGARSHAFGTTWFHGPTVADWNFTDRLALSSNRPASPFNGQLIYETDTNRYGARINGVWQPAPFNPPACRVFNTTAQAVADAGFLNPVLYDSEAFDTDSMHSTAVNTGRITINTAGIYLITAGGKFEGDTDYSYTQIELILNGVTHIAGTSNQTNSGAGYEPWDEATTVYKFAAGDFVVSAVYQDTAGGGNKNWLGGVTNNFFTATWIGVG